MQSRRKQKSNQNRVNLKKTNLKFNYKLNRNNMDEAKFMGDYTN